MPHAHAVTHNAQKCRVVGPFLSNHAYIQNCEQYHSPNVKWREHMNLVTPSYKVRGHTRRRRGSEWTPSRSRSKAARKQGITKREQGSKVAREYDAGARKQGSKGSRNQGGIKANKRGSKEARKQGSGGQEERSCSTDARGQAKMVRSSLKAGKYQAIQIRPPRSHATRLHTHIHTHLRPLVLGPPLLSVAALWPHPHPCRQQEVPAGIQRASAAWFYAAAVAAAGFDAAGGGHKGPKVVDHCGHSPLRHLAPYLAP
eukprot:1146989-Pelagomonas_calceolata.AAC.1